MILVPANRRIIRPYDKPSFEHTQRYGLIKGHPLGPAGGLVFLLPFNEGSGNKVWDLSGNEWKGTFGGTAPSWTVGKLGSAVLLPGTDEYIGIGDIDAVSTNKLTISIWATAKIESGCQMVTKYDSQNSKQAFNFAILSTGEVAFLISESGTNARQVKTTAVIFDIEKTETKHLVAIFDGTLATADKLKIYVNGVLEPNTAIITASDPITIHNSDVPLEIGRANKYGSGNPGGFFIGVLDLPAVYRRALVPSEVAQLYYDPFCMVQKKAAPVYFFVPVGVVKEITGAVVAASSTLGTLDVSRKIAGTIGGQGGTTGNLTVSRKLTGTITSVGSVTGNLTVSRKLVVSVITTSSITGWLSGLIELLTGTVTSISSVSGLLTLPAGGFSNFAEAKLLDHLVGKASYTKPVVAVGLCVANPTDVGTGANCNEVANTNGYARIPTTGDDWTTSVGGEIDNANVLTFPEASGNWGEITHYALFDSPVYGEGEMLLYDELDIAKTIIAEEIVRFSVGQLKLTLM